MRKSNANLIGKEADLVVGLRPTGDEDACNATRLLDQTFS